MYSDLGLILFTNAGESKQMAMDPWWFHFSPHMSLSIWI